MRMKKSETLRSILRNKNCLIGGTIVLFIVAMVVTAPIIAPYPPDKQDLEKSLDPPSLEHPLGTDALGRDLLSRIIYGARISLYVAISAVAFALVIAVPIGLFSGFYSNSAFDNVMMRLMDILLAFPSILLAITLIVILGRGLVSITIAVGIHSIPVFARLVRNSTLSIKEEDWVKAAKAIGEKNSSIVFRYIFPEVLPIILTQATLQIGMVILTASGLGFLGLGVQPPTPELGQMIGDNRLYIRNAPYLPIFPGIAIVLITLGFNLLGDGLNDILNPRLRRR
jgi:ABC-type dipeptide/oligopeptide/nickel transport system permease subunit